MLLLDVFDVVAAFSRALAPQATKLALDFWLRLDVHTTQAASANPRIAHPESKSRRNGFASLISIHSHQAAGSRHLTSDVAPPPRRHPGSSRIARLSPVSLESETALTLRWKGGEVSVMLEILH